MIAVSTVRAGQLADAVAPSVAVWTMVGLIALAGVGWVALAYPAWAAAESSHS